MSEDGSTWEWDGNAWTTYPSSMPEPWYYPAIGDIEWDPMLEAIVAMATIDGPGQLHAVTWRYDGNGVWTDLAAANVPASLACATAAYDDRRRRMVVFGPSDPVGAACGFYAERATYEYDSAANAWSQVPTTDAPLERGNNALVYNPDEQAIYNFGGETNYPNFTTRDDTWIYDGDWREVATAIHPPAGAAPAAVYDASQHEIVVISDDWEWILPSTAARRPGHILEVDLQTGGMVAGPTGDRLRRVNVRWDAEAWGFPGGTPVPGADLFVWRGAGWQRVATSTSGSLASAPATSASSR